MSVDFKHKALSITIIVKRFHPCGLGLVTTASAECTELLKSPYIDYRNSVGLLHHTILIHIGDLVVVEASYRI